MSILDKAYTEMGKKNEDAYIGIISDLYGKVKHTPYEFSRMDFVGENYWGELKSRNNSINDFPDFMFGYNKITVGFKKIKSGFRVFFWIALKEGLFEWELTQENYDLNGGDLQKKEGGTNNRGYDDYKYHYFVKRENWKKVSNHPVWVHPLVEQNTYKKSTLPVGVCLLKIK